jgi:hypothetical protein
VFTYVYSHYTLCLLLQILFVSTLDIKTRDVPTVSSINSLLSQYCKASHILLQIFVGGGGGQLLALPRLSHGQRPALFCSKAFSYQHLKMCFRRTKKIHKISHHISSLHIVRSSAVTRIMASIIRHLSESSERNMIVAFFDDILKSTDTFTVLFLSRAEWWFCFTYYAFIILAHWSPKFV